MKTIYNVAVLMDSQETCDRMKQLCIDNGLPICEYKTNFSYNKIKNGFELIFRFSDIFKSFAVWWEHDEDIRVTESEFIELLKNHKG